MMDTSTCMDIDECMEGMPSCFDCVNTIGRWIDISNQYIKFCFLKELWNEIYQNYNSRNCYQIDRLATSRPLCERSEPFSAAKRPTERRRRERSTFVPRPINCAEGLFESLPNWVKHKNNESKHKKKVQATHELQKKAGMDKLEND